MAGIMAADRGKGKENATVCKKIGEHHQMMALRIHFFAIDTGEEMF
jgi:hypothetical protein